MLNNKITYNNTKIFSVKIRVTFKLRAVFLDALSNGVVRFLLSFQYHTFCKTVTEVKPHFVKNVKMT